MTLPAAWDQHELAPLPGSAEGCQLLLNRSRYPLRPGRRAPHRHFGQTASPANSTEPRPCSRHGYSHSDDAVLVKGSRVACLERLAERLVADA